MCDLSGPDDLFQHVQDAIHRSGFGIVSVAGSARSAEFSYTVGLTEQGLPELVVVAVRPPDALRLLDLWGDYLRERSGAAGRDVGDRPLAAGGGGRGAP